MKFTPLYDLVSIKRTPGSDRWFDPGPRHREEGEARGGHGSSRRRRQAALYGSRQERRVGGRRRRGSSYSVRGNDVRIDGQEYACVFEGK